MITFEMHLNAYWYICAALLIFVAYWISLSRKTSPGHSTVRKERASRCTVHGNRHLAARLRPSAAVSSFQLRQKLVTCSLSSGDPITALKSLPVTMLIHSYLHMRPQKSEANCSPPLAPIIPPFPPAASFLCVQSVTSPTPRDCSLRRWPGAPLSDCQSCSGKLFGITVKNVPAESILIDGGDGETGQGGGWWRSRVAFRVWLFSYAVKRAFSHPDPYLSVTRQQPPV